MIHRTLFAGILWFTLLGVTACASIRSNDDLAKDNIITEGVGIEDIVVNQSTADDVIRSFGSDFVRHQKGDYAFELSYVKRGLSFHYFVYSDDKTQKIRRITIRAPYRGHTLKGIYLGQSTMQQVSDLYGEPAWRRTDANESWFGEYPGIEFHVEIDKSAPLYPLNKEIHLSKPIIRIDVITMSSR